MQTKQNEHEIQHHTDKPVFTERQIKHDAYRLKFRGGEERRLEVNSASEER